MKRASSNLYVLRMSAISEEIVVLDIVGNMQSKMRSDHSRIQTAFLAAVDALSVAESRCLELSGELFSVAVSAVAAFDVFLLVFIIEAAADIAQIVVIQLQSELFHIDSGIFDLLFECFEIETGIRKNLASLYVGDCFVQFCQDIFTETGAQFISQLAQFFFALFNDPADAGIMAARAMGVRSSR